MKLYLAPLEGITTYTYRRAYERNFGGVDRYFTPFIVNKKLGAREIEGILPENNPGEVLIPQIMSNRAEDFIQVAKEIATYGYDTVNLNLGCPSGTVVSKKRGAGFLAHPAELDAFLSEVYEKCPMRISIKTRIGLEDEREWENLLSIYEKYPMEELIIHPRLRTDYYKAPIRMEAFAEAVEQIKVPICYNGEINSVADVERIKVQFPQIDRIMIGRGILRYPHLIQQIRLAEQATRNGGAHVDNVIAGWEEADLKKRLRTFHDELLEDYRVIMSGDRNTLFKMKEIWTYMGESFEGADKCLKKIKKANQLADYKVAVNELFSLNLREF
ncbi:MAG: tRNA-dihydrouridine synthase family protein [Roseburia sp.]|nr:tRNA-dihydrouridine synthase family protein [Roseburia sp.]